MEMIRDYEEELGVQGFNEGWLPENKVGVMRFEDEGFVVTVSVRNVPGGYEVDYWTSGQTWSDTDNDFETMPKLLMRVLLGIKRQATLDDLIRQVVAAWKHQIIFSAHFSAYAGHSLRLGRQTADSNELDYHAKEHLLGHDRLNHFLDREGNESLTLRSARQYELLKSLGHTKPQKAILDYETNVMKHKLMFSALDRRLHTARQAELIPKKEKDKESFFSQSGDWE